MPMFEHDDGLETEAFFRLRDLPALPPHQPGAVFGGARRATGRDLRGYLNRPDEEHPSRLRDASLLLEAPDGRSYAPVYKRTLYLPRNTRTRNILGVGQVGAGKTSELIDPLVESDLRHPGCSVVLIDAKGDAHQKYAPFVERNRPGQSAIVLNLADAGRSTQGWNHLMQDADEQSDLEKAETICRAAESEAGLMRDYLYWFANGSRFIAATISCLRREHGTVCPAAVHRALEQPQRQILALWERHPDAPFAGAAHGFLTSGSHNAETVLSVAQMYLRSLRSPDLAAVTAADEFRFTTLFERPTVLIVEIPQGAVERVRTWVNVFVGELFRSAAAHAAGQPGCRLRVPLNIHGDDLVASIGRLHEFAHHLNLSRSRDIAVTVTAQSLSQIEYAFGTEAGSVLAGFATKLFRSPVEQHDAEWASRQCGTSTVEVTDRVEEADLYDTGGPRPTSRTVRPVARPLLLPEEIRYAPEHFAYGRSWTALLPDVPPFQAWLRAAYDLPDMAAPLADAARRPRPAVLRPVPLNWDPGVPSPTVEVRTFTNTTSMSTELVRQKIEETRASLDWGNTTGTARKWWEAFEGENRERLGLVLRLCEELATRNATITDFFLAYVYSNTDNIQANLHYLDYTRLKKEDEARKRADKGRVPRHQSGDTCPANAAGRYAFDGYLEGHTAPPPRDADRIIQVPPGSTFPLLRSSGNPCWWRRVPD